MEPGTTGVKVAREASGAFTPLEWRETLKLPGPKAESTSRSRESTVSGWEEVVKETAACEEEMLSGPGMGPKGPGIMLIIRSAERPMATVSEVLPVLLRAEVAAKEKPVKARERRRQRSFMGVRAIRVDGIPERGSGTRFPGI